MKLLLLTAPADLGGDGDKTKGLGTNLAALLGDQFPEQPGVRWKVPSGLQAMAEDLSLAADLDLTYMEIDVVDVLCAVGRPEAKWDALERIVREGGPGIAILAPQRTVAGLVTSLEVGRPHYGPLEPSALDAIAPGYALDLRRDDGRLLVGPDSIKEVTWA